jgi:hypothetical protein
MLARQVFYHLSHSPSPSPSLEGSTTFCTTKLRTKPLACESLSCSIWDYFVVDSLSSHYSILGTGMFIQEERKKTVSILNICRLPCYCYVKIQCNNYLHSIDIV